jgi:phenylpropionate dioxygenase-like ring-hydroxylating dioxygenase large terminal subunit
MFLLASFFVSVLNHYHTSKSVPSDSGSGSASEPTKQTISSRHVMLQEEQENTTVGDVKYPRPDKVKSPQAAEARVRPESVNGYDRPLTILSNGLIDRPLPRHYDTGASKWRALALLGIVSPLMYRSVVVVCARLVFLIFDSNPARPGPRITIAHQSSGTHHVLLEYLQVCSALALQKADSIAQWITALAGFELPLDLTLLVYGAMVTTGCLFSMHLTITIARYCCSSRSRTSSKPDIIHEYDQSMPEQRDLSSFPCPYPNGWYKLCDVDDIRGNEEAHYVRALGEHFAVFQGKESGNVTVLDAYCPHLGANLGIGGVVVGDCVQCPFHGWRFDAAGTCVDIPYSKSAPPKQASVKSWPAINYYGSVLVYYDADGRMPLYQPIPVPEIESGKYVFRGRVVKRVRMHIQDFAENSADNAHFATLHDRFDFPLIGPLIRIRHQTSWEMDPLVKHVSYFNDTANLTIWGHNIPGTQATANITFVGPGGLVHFRFRTPKGDIMLFKMFTPESPMLQRIEDLWFADRAIPRWLVSYIVGNFISAFGDDIGVWSSKLYARKPLLLREDGPIGPLRRWYRQFHSENSLTMQAALAQHTTTAIASKKPERKCQAHHTSSMNDW